MGKTQNINTASTGLTLDLAPSGVVAGTYTNAMITVDNYGRITSITNGNNNPFRSVIFTATGNANVWTIPTGVTSAKVTLIGGGGGGGNPIANHTASGGGAGATTIAYLTNVLIPGQTASIIIGAGGAANNDGQSSVFTYKTISFTAYNGSKGITGGVPADSSWSGGLGGGIFTLSAPIAGVTIWSIPGAQGINCTMTSTSAGNCGIPGAGANSFLGAAGGAPGWSLANQPGGNAIANTGAGGAGGNNVSGPVGTTGGNGGSGVCIIEY